MEQGRDDVNEYHFPGVDQHCLRNGGGGLRCAVGRRSGPGWLVATTVVELLFRIEETAVSAKSGQILQHVACEEQRQHRDRLQVSQQGGQVPVDGIWPQSNQAQDAHERPEKLCSSFGGGGGGGGFCFASQLKFTIFGSFSMESFFWFGLCCFPRWRPRGRCFRSLWCTCSDSEGEKKKCGKDFIATLFYSSVG
uniref:(northern house mosquito) hypothetical protein n=1 Tax=Culex pipiens TaxID=7175 RepID=A0A8D8CZ53_CULPI